jgi:hypothetical protein
MSWLAFKNLTELERCIWWTQDCEDRKDLVARNSEASAIFDKRYWRKGFITATRGVETWWDYRSRNFITQVVDVNGCEVEPANYTGNKSDAAIAHFWALSRCLKGGAQ